MGATQPITVKSIGNTNYSFFATSTMSTGCFEISLNEYEKKLTIPTKFFGSSFESDGYLHFTEECLLQLQAFDICETIPTKVKLEAYEIILRLGLILVTQKLYKNI